MNGPSLSRRTAIGAIIALGTGLSVSSPGRRYLNLLAPGSGDVWADLGPPPSGPISSPYGDATIAYDDEGVPHIAADDERALQFAHGFAQGYDRLFQMDILRRQYRGELSALVGPVTLDIDEFHVTMGFADAAAASARTLEGTDTMAVVEAFVEGINHARDRTDPPVEAGLLEYTIDPWTPTDSLLIEKVIGWELTGRFRTLRRRALAEAFGDDLVADLYPARYDHDVPILDRGAASTEPASETDAQPSIPRRTVDWLSGFEAPPGVGSNSWVISGDHTASGGPILANDPHLTLAAPPVWYEVGHETPAFAARGVTFPGTPFVVIGRTRHAAWGFTNVPADVIDFYTYETDGDTYRYGDEWRDFDRVDRTIRVAGDGDREVSIRRTVHGPLIDRHGAEVAVAWTGLTATRTIEALHALQHADSFESAMDAMARWDLPPQNFVYADRDGRTMYHLVGTIPIRRIDGDAVRADRLFDGSAPEGEWAGYTPYGESTWEDVIQFDELPQAIDADIVSTANQRVIDEPAHYFAENHATPYRAYRLVERLDAAIEAGDTDVEESIAIQQDVHDALAATLVPTILMTVESTEDRAEPLAALEAWDYAMEAGSRGALVYARWIEAFRGVVFGRSFDDAGFDEGYWPSDFVLATLGDDHPWFDVAGDRSALITEAFDLAIARIADGAVLGDYQRTYIDHPLGLGGFNYPRRGMPGSPNTLKNFRMERAVGPGWQQVIDFGADVAVGRLAGGNAGRRLSPHYADQLDAWIDGAYKPLAWSVEPSRVVEVRGVDR